MELLDYFITLLYKLFSHVGKYSTIYWIIALSIFSIVLMFFWEGKVRWWLRLPGINLIVFIVLLIGGIIEECYLTFHPEKRTKWIKSSIFQLFFT